MKPQKNNNNSIENECIYYKYNTGTCFHYPYTNYDLFFNQSIILIKLN